MTIMPSWYSWFKDWSPEPKVNGEWPAMPFPTIDPSIPRAEIISAEAISVSALSKNLTAALELAKQFTDSNAQALGLTDGGVTSPFYPGVGNANNTDYNIPSTAAQVQLWFDGIASSNIAAVAYPALQYLADQFHHSKTAIPIAYYDFSSSGKVFNNTNTSTTLFYDQVTLNAYPKTNGAKVFYTTDGTDPVPYGSRRYTAPVVISLPKDFGVVANYTVKFISLLDGLTNPSSVTQISFSIQRTPPVCSSGLELVSLITCVNATGTTQIRSFATVQKAFLNRFGLIWASMIGAFVGYNFLLLLCAIVLAAKTRTVTSNHNESQLIGLTTCTFSISALVTVPLFVVPGLDAQSKFALLSGITILLTGVIIFAFCGMKLYSIIRNTSGEDDSSGSHNLIGNASMLKQAKDKEESNKVGEDIVQVYRLYARPAGMFSKWASCRLTCNTKKDLLTVVTTETAEVLFGAKLSTCIVSGIAQTHGYWTGVLMTPGKGGVKIQMSSEENIKSVAAPSGSVTNSAASQLSAGSGVKPKVASTHAL
ncbi:hypothetical protein HDU76_006582 [Blyttiomyces sp. JEL0837]|nr:hypothetical protein HDU76_006582 [Blyttiomyces sp. JEL0837]